MSTEIKLQSNTPLSSLANSCGLTSFLSAVHVPSYLYFLTAQLTAMESLPRESSSLRGSPKPVVDDYNSPEKIEKRKTKRIK